MKVEPAKAKIRDGMIVEAQRNVESPKKLGMACISDGDDPSRIHVNPFDGGYGEEYERHLVKPVTKSIAVVDGVVVT